MSSVLIPSTHNMSDSSTPSRFLLFFDAALQDYEKQTGTNLADHPFAKQLESCDSVESITTFFQEQAQGFSEFRGNDSRIMRPLKSAVSILHTLSTSTVLGEAIGLPFPPAKAIFAGIAILLAAVKDVSAGFDALVDLLECMGKFLNRLDIYTRIPPTAAMTEVVVKILVELISTLTLATKQVKQGRPKKFMKKLLGENEVEAVLQRLDRLTQDEARAAAAQTLDVVYGLVQNMKVVIEDGKASVDNIRDALKIMQQSASGMKKAKRERVQQDVRIWLSPPDPWKNHNIAYKSHHSGTATWFLEGSTFAEWKASGSNSILWIHGKPGAGKSVLCSTIVENIDEMRKCGLVSLAFFYCDFRDDAKKDRRGLLSSLLVQLCEQSDSYCDILSDFYLAHRRGSQHPGDDALLQCVIRMLKLSGEVPIFIILDALDELPNATGMPSPRDEVMSFVGELVGLYIPNLRICVTSRPEADLQLVLDHLSFRSISLHSEGGQIQGIVEYIKFVVNTDPMMRRWKAADKELVIDVLTNKANGMFRWVFCQLVYLRRCIPARIRRALDELPVTLDETYERTLREIDEQNWEYAHHIFQCVAVATRPLRVEELADLLAFDFNMGSTIPIFQAEWRAEDPGQAVLSTCSSLLSIVKAGESQVIEFSHFSVKEYLTSARLAKARDIISRYHISLTPAHTIVAQACLGVLLHIDRSVSRDCLKNCPLVEYAARHWTDHACFEGVSPTIQDGVKRLFDPDKPHLAIWVWLHDPLGSSRNSEQWKRPSQLRRTPLHYAATCGLYDVVTFLVIERSQNVNARASYDKSTPLHVASNVKVAELLLEYGADAMAQDVHGQNPLHWASWRGNAEITRLLLQHGADARTLDERKQTPLFKAWNVEVARLLLEKGANANIRDEGKRTPLHEVSSSFPECVEVARLLLEHGADAKAVDEYNRTPLHGAQSVEVVHVLLQYGADATAADEEKRTPLHEFSSVSQENAEVVRLLLEHGADPTARDQRKRTPLHEASKMEVVRLLLEHGADPSAQDEEKRTPLHGESHRELSVEVAQLLLEHGADPSAADNFKWTPLHGKLSAGVARLLLEHGADPSSRDNSNRTPLHGKLNVEVARLLLEHGADPIAQDNEKQTPLHVASSPEGDVEVVRLLLEYGVDPTAQDKYQCTPLHCANNVLIARLLLEHGASPTARNEHGQTALYRSNVDVAQLLLERGADAMVHDNYNLTPLHLASSGGAALARLLLEHGADPTARDKFEQTPLHRASTEDVVRLLLDYGADPTAQGEHKRTPLHRAWSIEVVQLLLENGADPTAQDEHKRTPLHDAHTVGIARLLLEHGADPSAKDEEQRTPLHGVSSVEVAQLLLERGADAMAQDKHKRTPLHGMKSVEVARLLLEHGADPTARGEHEQTPLHGVPSEELARLLLHHGADPAAQDEHRRTPLHGLHNSFDNAGIVRLLLEHGADATARDAYNLTPLHFVSSFRSHPGDARAMRLLLKHGANPTALDVAKRTPLHMATASFGDALLTRVLLEHGADATAQDEEMRTPMHCLSSPLPEDVEIARLLLEHGADPTVEDIHKRTPLDVALNINMGVAQLLREHIANASAQDNSLAQEASANEHRGDTQLPLEDGGR